MNTHNLDYKGVNLEVTGTYHEGIEGTFDNAPVADEFQIQLVTINGVDCNELLENEMANIEEKVIEKHY